MANGFARRSSIGGASPAGGMEVLGQKAYARVLGIIVVIGQYVIFAVRKEQIRLEAGKA